MYGDPLTTLEHAALAAILSPRHPIMDALRAQLAECRTKSREFTGVGFFTELVVPARTAIDGLGDVVLTGADADIEGLEHGATFVLFVRDGMIATLEGVTFTEPWPDEIGTFHITYRSEPTDLERLSWGRWWRLTGKADLVSLLFRAWNPMGLDNEWPESEYECMADPVAALLRNGASTDAIAETLADHRTAHFGADPDPQSDGRMAAELLTWYAAARPDG